MRISKLQYSISIIALTLIVIHIVIPSFSIDGITLGFLVIAILPWLSPIFKTVEFPGGLKVEFQDLLRTEKKANDAGLLGPVESESSSKKYSYQLIQKSDPNLALAGLRLEIETRLRRIAEDHRIPVLPQGASLLVKELIRNKIFIEKEGLVIIELLDLLNSAVHGAEVEYAAVEWANEVGPRILDALDDR